MAVVLGIDIGTGSLKGMLLDTEKGVLAVRAKEYGVDFPRPDYAEQDPQVWWSAFLDVLSELRGVLRLEKPEAEIAAIGLSGQMHGLVLTDNNREAVRPAILWLDQRSKDQLAEIGREMSEEEMGEIFCNRVSCGFAFPSLLWVRENEPETLEKAAALLCPKDYLRMRLTGKAGAEAVDASSTCLFDTAKRDWAYEVIDRFGLPRRLFPPVGEPMDVAGFVSSACAGETGLPEGIPVVYGSGDQPAQSIGNGVFEEGSLICNLGTGGQISAFVREPRYDRCLRTNTFCHAAGGYTLFGATLCGGKSMRWVKNDVFHMDSYAQADREAAAVPAGSDGAIYLPYLSGERTPHMDPDAKGTFFGLTLRHGRGHFLRAVMEGVAYSLRDCLTLMQELGADAPEVIASGGGAASGVWLQIQADILQKPVRACTVKEQACLGACLLAAVGTGLLPSLTEGRRRFVTMEETSWEPIPAHRAVYDERYGTFQELYRRTKDLMKAK